jgi:pyridoxamine 5'-phosphate oxidase
MDKQSVAAMRRDYSQRALDESAVDTNPMKQFERWFEESVSNDLLEPNAFTVSTVSAENKPYSRVVLMKSYDENGIVFFTNYESSKAKQLAENPNVALNFLWLEMERQVRIEGVVERISKLESLNYFVSRPQGSQLGAWVSPQSSIISSRAILEEKWEQMKRKFKDGKIPLPDNWGGYRVKPNYFEFWQGRSSRLHDRVIYRPNDHNETSSWEIKRLAP